MNDESQTAESRTDLLAPLLVILAILAVVMLVAWNNRDTENCTFCAGSVAKQGFGPKVVEEAPRLNFSFNNNNVDIKEDEGMKLPMSPPQPVPAESKKSGLQCDFGVSTLIIESVVNFSEISLPFVGIGKDGMSLSETHTDHGRLTTGTLVTCAQIVKKSFWIGFDGDYSPAEEDDLKASVHIMDLHFQSGKDFDLIACDEGDYNPDECRELGVHDDALHTFYAIVWR